MKYVIIGVVFVVLAFCVGRSCAPAPINTRQRAEDSVAREQTREIGLISAANKRAEAAYDKGVAEGEKRAVRVTRYISDTTHNHTLRKAVRDSLIKAWLRLGALDSTKLSGQASREVWDLGSELNLVWDNAKSDSSEIANLKIAYAKKDAVLIICRNAGRADSALVSMVNQDKKVMQKEVRKQKRLKWLAIIGGVAGILLH